MVAPVQTRQELMEILREQEDRLGSLGVRRLGLFGSFQRDEADENSDVDFLVEFYDGDKTFEHLLELSELLERKLGRPVELVTRASLSSTMADAIEQEIDYVETDGGVSRTHPR